MRVKREKTGASRSFQSCVFINGFAAEFCLCLDSFQLSCSGRPWPFAILAILGQSEWMFYFPGRLFWLLRKNLNG